MKDLAAHSYPTISHMKGCKPTCLWEAKWYFGMLILNQRHEGAIGLWQISCRNWYVLMWEMILKRIKRHQKIDLQIGFN